MKREVNSATENLDLEKDITNNSEKEKNKKKENE